MTLTHKGAIVSVRLGNSEFLPSYLACRLTVLSHGFRERPETCRAQRRKIAKPMFSMGGDPIFRSLLAVLRTYTHQSYEFRPSTEQVSGKSGRYPVIVVGAGPVGLTAAVDLVD